MNNPNLTYKTIASPLAITTLSETLECYSEFLPKAQRSLSSTTTPHPTPPHHSRILSLGKKGMTLLRTELYKIHNEPLCASLPLSPLSKTYPLSKSMEQPKKMQKEVRQEIPRTA